MKSNTNDLQIINIKSKNNDIQDLLFEYLNKKDKNDISNQISNKINDVCEIEDKDKFIDSLRENTKTKDEVINEVANKSVNQTEKELALETNDDKDKKIEGSDYTKRQLMLKVVYEDTLNKYYDLKENLYKRNIRENGELSFSDSEYNKLILYSKYLKKIDLAYGKTDSSRHIAQEFDDTNSMLNNNVRNEDKYQKYLNKNHDEKIQINKDLEEKLENLSQDIIALDSQDDNYLEKYEYMMDVYTRLDAKLHMNEPNILTLQLDEERRQEEINVEDKVLGLGYKKDLRNKTYTSKNIVTDKKEISKQKRDGIYYNDSNTVSENQSNDISNSHKLVIAESLEAMVEKVKSNDVEGAREIYDKVKLLVTEVEMKKAIDDSKEITLDDVNPENVKKKSDNIFAADSLSISEIAENMEERELEDKNVSKSDKIYEERNWLEENLNKNKKF